VAQLAEVSRERLDHPPAHLRTLRSLAAMACVRARNIQ
jgi:hypothetical protein